MRNIKRQLKFVLYPVMALLLITLALPALAAPPGLPHTFSGAVTISGVDAPVDTVISARFNDVEYGTVTTTVIGQYSGLAVTGLTNGDTIHFYVNDQDTTQTFVFESGATTEGFNLNLPVPDTTHPTVTLTSTLTSPTNTSPIPVTANFSEDVNGFELGDITVGNGSAGNFFCASDSLYTFDVTPTADGVVTVDITADVANDAASNGNLAATQFSITYDSTRPTVTITSTASDPTSTSPIPVTATFSEDVTGFEVEDITVGNGSAGNFAAGEGPTYTFDVTPAAEGEVTVDIAADVAEDAAGNGNTAATQFSITYTAAPPAVTIDAVTTPTNVATQTLTGTKASEVTVTMGGTATYGAVSYPTDTTWSCVATLTEGSNTITATADTTTAEATIVLDTTAPTVTGKSPASGATDVLVTTTVTATFSESMKASTITTTSFTLSSDAGAITGTVAYNDITKTTTFTPSANLNNGTTYTATLSTAITDAIGNPLVSDNSWSFTTIAGSLGDGINNTPSGGTFNLNGGTYTGNTIIDKPITITGGTVLGGITINELTGSEVILENLTITDYTDFGIRIVNVRSVDTFIIRNNTIQGISGSVVGILVDKVEAGGSLTIEQNSILDNQTGIKLLAAVTDTTIKYNDITNNSVAGLKVLAGGNTDYAAYNWWGDISGPEEPDYNPRGEGNAIIGNADYQPWLTKQFATVLADNIAYFGSACVSLSTGWNIFSTPIALDSSADTWGEYVALGSPDLHIHGTSPAYAFNTQQGIFVAVTSEYQLKPCDAIYVRMTQADKAPILYSPDMSVPTKTLYTGWNLVGLADLGDMSVTNALTSVYKVSGDYTGYIQVISPAIGNQTSWVYIRDAGSVPDMKWTKGYWVFMVNAPTGTTLAGFTFTPITPSP
jgi:hypothetical protein